MSAPAGRGLAHKRFGAPHGTPRRADRQTYVGRLVGLIANPSIAFALMTPNIGFYACMTYVNAFAPDGSLGSIVIRAGSLALLLLAWIVSARSLRPVLHRHLIPFALFVAVYLYRLLENMWHLGLEMYPSNAYVLSIFLLAVVGPALLLGACAPKIRDEDMTFALTGFLVLFLIGVALNLDALVQTAQSRMLLDKINPIALAYTASSFLLYYMLSFARSKRAAVEALVCVPALLLVVVFARSRGMLISTALTIFFYVMASRGTRRLWTAFGLGLLAVAAGLWADPIYLDTVVESLNRIDTKTDASTMARVMTFNGAWNQFVRDPVFGRHAIELQAQFYPHNIYLESLMAVGLFGSWFLALHVWFAMRAAVGFVREREPSFARIFISLLFVRDAVGSGISGGLWGASGFWITSVVLIALRYGPKAKAPRPGAPHFARPAARR
ncbi:MAG: hypothetical protein JWN93_1002 [Hyphomicrobiales bacterium]|nr:hypothetical protein [Hyphomicrobiales bacterium]